MPPKAPPPVPRKWHSTLIGSGIVLLRETGDGAYEANDDVFVTKEENLPNSPELHPIEKFWTIMKDNLRKTGKVFKNDQ